MARSRDLFKKDALEARDIAQVWVLSLVAVALLSSIIIVTGGDFTSITDFLKRIGVALLWVVGIDAAMLAAIIAISFAQRLIDR